MARVVPQYSYKPPPEHLILKRRAEIERRRVYDNMNKEDEFIHKRIQFEERGDAKGKEALVTRRLKELEAEQEEKLQRRREKLKALLEAEEAQYLEEAVATVETPLEKMAKMRVRARELREKREAERQEFAAEMLEKAWQENCEPLRALQAKKTKELISFQLGAQIEEKKWLEQHERAVENFYAEQEEMDRVAKEARELNDLKKRREGDSYMLECLNEQIKMLEANRAEEARLQEEEKVIRLEQEKLVKEQERQEQEEELQKKLRLKAILDHDMQAKQQERAARMEVEMLADQKLLEQLKEEAEADHSGGIIRKQRLAQEMKQYMDYLQSLKGIQEEFEKQRETAMESVRKEVEKKQIAKWRAERHKRKELMKEVVNMLQIQKEQKRQEIEDERRKNHEEGLELAARVRELNKQAEEEAEQLKQTNVLFGHHLEEQIEHQAARRRDEIAADKEMIRTLMENDRLEDERINREIDRVNNMSLDLSISGRGMK